MVIRRPTWGAAVALGIAAGAGCLGTGDPKGQAGLVSDDPGPFGPSVVFDPLALPVPEVPFPNDLLLRPDAGTPSGRAWNISTEAPTRVERRLRGMLNRLDGFGPFAPIFVPFDGPLDLSTVTPDTVLLVNIQEGHPREGEIAPLDLGRGYIPWPMKPHGYWPFDAMSDAPSIVFPPDNLADADGDGVPEFVSHYEVATHTLVLRPVLPLATGATYAVLVTRGVQGATGTKGSAAFAPVRSPFAFKAHAAQAGLVKRAVDLAGLDPDDLAFGFTYTTSDVAAAPKAWRDGLYGEGPLSRLAEGFPPGFAAVHDLTVTIDGDTDGDGAPDDPRDHRFILQPKLISDLFELVGPAVGDQYARSISFDHVDHFVFGMLRTPDLRTGEARTFGVDPVSGEGEVGENQVPFFASIPVTVPGVREPPFPVVVYFHGTGTSRMELLAVADNFARQGLAAVSFDEVGHGPILPDVALALEQADLSPDLVEALAPVLAEALVPEKVEEFEGLAWYEAIEEMEEIGLWRELAVHGRTEDQNANGTLESSESFFFADPFKQCASFWQDMVDMFHLVRTLRSLDPAAVPPAVADPASASPEELLPNLLAGDFDADGVLDLGGPVVQIGSAGTSLGGFHATLAAALEPEITVSTPIVGGGGYADIMVRSDLHFVTERVFLEIFGPLVVGCPDGQGGVWLSWNDDSDGCKAERAATKGFAAVPAVLPGDGVVVTNLANGEIGTGTVNEQGGFAVAVACDRWDPVVVEIARAGGDVAKVPSLTPYDGTAFERNSPRFRCFLGISQHVLDRCDPISFARNLFLEPLPGHPPVNILFEQALGDEAVPIATGMILGLAAGVFGDDESEWRPRMETLVAEGALLGSDYDPDDLQGDNPPESPGLGPLVPVPTGAGVASMRFADVHGYHEWMVDIDQEKPFDHAYYSQSQIALFHASGGKVVVDDLCIAKQDCPLLDAGP